MYVNAQGNSKLANMERFLLIDENTGVILDRVIAPSQERARLVFDNTGKRGVGQVISEAEYTLESELNNLESQSPEG